MGAIVVPVPEGVGEPEAGVPPTAGGDVPVPPTGVGVTGVGVPAAGLLGPAPGVEGPVAEGLDGGAVPVPVPVEAGDPVPVLGGSDVAAPDGEVEAGSTSGMGASELSVIVAGVTGSARCTGAVPAELARGELSEVVILTAGTVLGAGDCPEGAAVAVTVACSGGRAIRAACGWA